MTKLEQILKNLQDKHGGGQALTEEQYEEMQCKWANDNEGNLHEKDGYNCTVCKNKGIVYFLQKSYKDSNVMTVKNCECMRIRNTLKRAKESGLNNILTDYTFDKYETTEQWQTVIKNKAQEFCADNTANWFYIGGSTGIGKTHICTAIAGHYIKQGKECRYMLWRDDAVKLKQLVNEYTEYQAAMNELKNVPVLYIDDFFKTQHGEQPTKGDINLAFEILNHRLMNPELITIISSEKTMMNLLEYDEATMSRIYQHTGKYKTDIPKDIKKNYRLKD